MQEQEERWWADLAQSKFPFTNMLLEALFDYPAFEELCGGDSTHPGFPLPEVNEEQRLKLLHSLGRVAALRKLDFEEKQLLSAAEYKRKVAFFEKLQEHRDQIHTHVIHLISKLDAAESNPVLDSFYANTRQGLVRVLGEVSLQLKEKPPLPDDYTPETWYRKELLQQIGSTTILTRTFKEQVLQVLRFLKMIQAIFTTHGCGVLVRYDHSKGNPKFLKSEEEVSTHIADQITNLTEMNSMLTHWLEVDLKP
jgi:hypothetical protein